MSRAFLDPVFTQCVSRRTEGQWHILHNLPKNAAALLERLELHGQLKSKRHIRDVITRFANVLPVFYLLRTCLNFQFKKQVLPVTRSKCPAVSQKALQGSLNSARGGWDGWGGSATALWRTFLQSLLFSEIRRRWWHVLFLDVLFAEAETRASRDRLRKQSRQGLIYRGQGMGGSICRERGIHNCTFAYELHRGTGISSRLLS